MPVLQAKTDKRKPSPYSSLSFQRIVIRRNLRFIDELRSYTTSRDNRDLTKGDILQTVLFDKEQGMSSEQFKIIAQERILETKIRDSRIIINTSFKDD